MEESKKMSTVIIGIAGGSASGKSLIAKRLMQKYGKENSVVIIKLDDYYKDQSHLTMDQRVLTNYDHPFAFDLDLLLEHLVQLISGKSINKPIYDFVQHTRSDKTEVINPCDVLLLEGLFVLDDERIRALSSIKIYVDTDADIRFIRRLLRDVEERGRSLESVTNQYMNTVRVMHDQFIEPSKRFADVIIPEGGHNEVAIDLLTTKISSIIKSNML